MIASMYKDRNVFIRIIDVFNRCIRTSSDSLLLHCSMGNFFSGPHKSKLLMYADLWPYLWAIRDPECLDWKKGLSPETIQSIALSHANLPVQVSSLDQWLYLSDARAAHDVERLVSLGISAVVNCAGRGGRSEVAIKAYKNAGIGYKELKGEDEEGYRMLGLHLHTTQRFVESELARKKGGKVLIHCVAGVNRSGVIICSLKMLKERKNVLDVVAEVRLARGNVCLQNFTFQEELVDLARREGLLGPAPGQEGCRVKVKGPANKGSVTLGDFGLRAKKVPRDSFKSIF